MNGSEHSSSIKSSLIRLTVSLIKLLIEIILHHDIRILALSRAVFAAFTL